MSVAGTAGAEANDRAERKSVTVYRGRVNRRAGATVDVGKNSAVFPIEVIRFIQPTRAGFLVDVTLREHRRHPGSARKKRTLLVGVQILIRRDYPMDIPLKVRPSRGVESSRPSEPANALA
jgi:hypothetical protein